MSRRFVLPALIAVLGAAAWSPLTAFVSSPISDTKVAANDERLNGTWFAVSATSLEVGVSRLTLKPNTEGSFG